MLTLDGVETKKLLREAEGTRLFAFAVVGLTSGLRRGELLGLTWRDIDFERSRLTVNRALEETRGSLVLKPAAPRVAAKRRATGRWTRLL